MACACGKQWNAAHSASATGTPLTKPLQPLITPLARCSPGKEMQGSQEVEEEQRSTENLKHLLKDCKSGLGNGVTRPNIAITSHRTVTESLELHEWHTCNGCAHDSKAEDWIAVDVRLQQSQ